MRHFFTKLLFSLVIFWAGIASAEALERPEGDIVLTVSGEIGQKNTEDAASFDMEMLKELPNTSFTTTTIWTEGEQTFEGVPLSEILKIVGATSGVLRATAINDYAVEIPIDEIEDEFPIIAYSMNGEPMSRRQKGPLWIVYPFDNDARYRSEMVFSRSIWQLDRLEVTK